MLKRFSHALTLLSFAASIVFLSCGYQPSVKERSFSFLYDVSVFPIKNPGSIIKMWVPLPESNEYQTISGLSIKSPINYSTHTDSTYGNTMAFFSAESPLPSGLNVTITFNVIRKERGITPTSLTPEERSLYLAPRAFVPRNERFQEIAGDVVSSDRPTMKNGRLLYNHVLSRMKYDKSGNGWGRGDAIYACDIGAGNCTDFHSLFNAVSRAADIPARFLIGFPVPGGEEGTIDGYHCWAEFYTPDRGWVPVDLSDAYKQSDKKDYLFGNLDPNRVFFTAGRDIELVPPSQGGSVNFFIYPVIEIDGLRTNSYEKRFFYRSLPD